MLYAQVSRAFGLNDVCDALRLQVTALLTMRRAAPRRPPATPSVMPTRSAPAGAASRFCPRRQKFLRQVVPPRDPHRRHHHPARGELHHLDETPTAQGCGKVLPVDGPVEFPAAFRDLGHRRRTRQPARPGTVRRPARGGNSALRQDVFDFSVPVAADRPVRLLGHPRERQPRSESETNAGPRTPIHASCTTISSCSRSPRPRRIIRKSCAASPPKSSPTARNA